MKEFVLHNGVKAPALAYGTWLIKTKSVLKINPLWQNILRGF